MLTLEEAIKKYKRDEKVYRIMAHHNNSSYVPKKIADEYKQLAEWLRELQERREAPEIVRCGECELKLVCCRTIRSEGRRDDDFCSCGIREERRTE